MDSTRCILQKSVPLFAIMIMLSALVAIFSGYGILSVFITSSLLIVSPIIFIFKKQIEVEDVEGDVLSHICSEQRDSSLLDQDCKTVQEVPVGQDEQCLSQAENSSPAEEINTEPIAQQSALHQHHLYGHQIHGCSVGSSHHDLYSESDSIDPSFSSTEDSDNDWTYSSNFGQSPECSDDSISDEESLIEIAIPSGHYVCPKESKFTLQQKFQNSAAGTFLDQHGVLEQFAKINEMNEEDNLIEIDLSMGSIKCSRFEIEA